MSWQAPTFGLMLGCGVLLCFQGFQAMTDQTVPEIERKNQTVPEIERKKGFWKLNGGVALVVVSLVAILHVVPGT